MKLAPENDCTGCGTCKESCPVNAISMTKDSNGFIIPKIDKNKCKNCNICKNKCPILNQKKTEINNFEYFAAFSKNIDVLKNSSSGGIFYELSANFIRNGGEVYGVTFGKDLGAYYISVDNIENLKKIMGSKYLQSNAYMVFKEVKEKLDNGKKILFSGTPCQITGLKKYLGKEYNNLVTVDFICTGVPSKVIFDTYISHLEKKLNDKFINIDFRNKSKGWYNYSVKIEFEKKSISHSRFFDPLILLQYKNLSLRESCYNCKYREGKSESDIQLGDFWNIEILKNNFYNKNGISAVIVKTKNGKNLFLNILNCIEYIEVTKDDLIKINKSYSDCKLDITQRNKFFEEFNKANNKYKVIKKYTKIKLIDKLKIKKNLFLRKIKKR